MTAVILTFHVLIVLGLIVMVLLQRSDGGALGIGGGGGGGFMSGRSAANALTRTTSFLAAIFFATSLSLAIIAGVGESEESVIEELTGEAAPDPNAGPSGLTTEDLLQSLGGETDGEEPGEGAIVDLEAPSASELLDALGRETDAPQTPAADPQGETSEEPDPEDDE